MIRCVATPISWLTLERYAVDELPDPYREEVAAHLAACGSCRRCLDTITRNERSLPPLAAPTVVARRWWRHPAWGWAGVAVAAAAVLVVAVKRPRSGGQAMTANAVPAQKVRVKGGALAIGLVRDRAGATTLAPREFAAGDRFKVLVTCPPGRAFADVAVFQNGEAAFPLAVAPLACGNRVAIPGAFRITGRAPAVVCATIRRDAPPDRAALARGPRGIRNAACVTLRPARRRPAR